MGDTITSPDIRLFVTLTRFDLVFYQKYLLNKKRLVDYPNLWNYAKDLFSNPASEGTRTSTPCVFASTTSTTPRLQICQDSCRKARMTAAGWNRMTEQRNFPRNNQE